MVRTMPCPQPESLKKLLLGQLARRDAEGLEQHLLHCATCLKTVKTLRTSDTLIDVLQDQTIGTPPPIDDRVVALIARLEKLRPAKSPLTEDTAAEAFSPDAADSSTADLKQLGPYRILKLLGAGGMGQVYQAEDTQLQRVVALKVMKPEVATNATARERFLREARAAAKVQHDHLVTIYQVGEDNGVPYLAMQYLEGHPLDAWLKSGKKPTTAQLLRVGREIAKGLAAAHKHGLIHRDIKPGNVWLEAPQGRVKILDFGLARAAIDDVQLTQSGAIVGTPAYMAPEQARGEKVDARSDLFSLGCVLYRLATGDLPFKGDTTMAVLTSLAMDEPKPVAEVNPNLPLPVVELINRLLAKKPEGRPQSADEVVKLIKTLERESASGVRQAPVASGGRQPPEAANKTQGADAPRSPIPVSVMKTQGADAPRSPKLAKRRSRLPIGIAVLLLVLLGVGGGLFGVTLFRVVTNKGELVVQVDDPNVEVSVKQNGVIIHDKTALRDFVLNAGDGEVLVTDKDGLSLATKRFTLTRGGKETVVVTLQELADGRKKPQPPAVFPAGASPLDALRREAIDAEELKTAGDGEAARAPQQLVAVVGDSRLKMTNAIDGLAFSPDGKQLLASSIWEGAGLWDVTTMRKVRDLAGSRGEYGVSGAAFGTDGKWIAITRKGKTALGVALIDAATGEQKQLLEPPPFYDVKSFGFSKDGQLMAMGCQHKTTRVWDTVTGKVRHTLEPEGFYVQSVALSPDGKIVATAGRDDKGGALLLHDTDSGQLLRTLNNVDPRDYNAVVFAPDGSWVAATTIGRVVVWETATGKQKLSLEWKDGTPVVVAVSPDGKTLAAGGHSSQLDRGKMIRLWNLEAVKEPRLLSDAAVVDRVGALAFSPDGKTLACGGSSGAIQLFDVDTGKGRVVRSESGHVGAVSCLMLTPDGKSLVTGGYDGTVQIYALETLPLRPRIATASHNRPITSIALSPDGKTLAALVSNGTRFWDPATGKESGKPITATGGWGAFDPQAGRWIINNSPVSPGVRFIDGGALTLRPEGYSLPGRAIHWSLSPNGRVLAASARLTKEVWLHEAESGQEIVRLTSDSDCHALAFSPDSRILAHAFNNDKTRLWDIAEKKELRTLDTGSRGLAFSPNGQWLAVVDQTGRFRVYEAATGKLLQDFRCGSSTVRNVAWPIAFTRDGRHLISGNPNGTLAVFRLAPPPHE